MRVIVAHLCVASNLYVFKPKPIINAIERTAVSCKAAARGASAAQDLHDHDADA